MSANDGGPVIRVERAKIDRPPIHRGEFVLPLDALTRTGVDASGYRISFERTIEVEGGDRFDLRYHDAEIVEIVEPNGIPGEDPGVYVHVGPDVVVTWERI